MVYARRSNPVSYEARASISQDYWRDINEDWVWGTEVPQKLKLFLLNYT